MLSIPIQTPSALQKAWVPETNPHITIPPRIIAVEGEPGMPSVSIGKRAPVEAELFADFVATTPSTYPFPKLSEFFDVIFFF